MVEQLQNFDYSQLMSINNLVFISIGFTIGKMKPKKLGSGFVAIVRKVTPKPIKKTVLSFLNRFAKGIDSAIKDNEVK